MIGLDWDWNWGIGGVCFLFVCWLLGVSWFLYSMDSLVRRELLLRWFCAGVVERDV